jgi:hypothetical protein
MHLGERSNYSYLSRHSSFFKRKMCESLLAPLMAVNLGRVRNISSGTVRQPLPGVIFSVKDNQKKKFEEKKWQKTTKEYNAN